MQGARRKKGLSGRRRQDKRPTMKIGKTTTGSLWLIQADRDNIDKKKYLNLTLFIIKGYQLNE